MVLTIQKKTIFILAVRTVMSVAAYEFMLQRAYNLICTKTLLTHDKSFFGCTHEQIPVFTPESLCLN